MKLYKLTFIDLEQGKVVRFERNLPGVRAISKQWKQEFPLRKLMLKERIDVPEAKGDFVEWLNATIAGDDHEQSTD